MSKRTANTKRRVTRPLAERLWAKVAISGKDDCWPFLGTKNWKGYGQIFRSKRGGKRVELAHRAALIVSGVDIPRGMQALHKCDNPPCCNPSHLFVGTPADNMADKIRKGRSKVGRTPRGFEHHNAALSEEQVSAIRGSRATATEIALAIGVTPETIRKARNGRSYKNCGAPVKRKRWLVLGKEYNSVIEAAIEHGTSRSTICRWCLGRRDGGYEYGPKDGCGLIEDADPDWKSMVMEYASV